ncbi:MAG: NAD(P)H-hydrate epimerase [Clostridia bacterium]|nr:NAD(P)H-hydrate epimerase [Clostridia bacterium]
MYRAGKSIFEKVCWRAPVAIVAGKGNNAGDGYVVAKLLKDSGVDCRIYLIDENRFSEDGEYYFEVCRDAGIPYEQFTEETDLTAYGSILDCLLGTGFAGDVRGITKTAIEEINRCGKMGSFIVAADINSGLNGDTGEGTTFVKSDLTVSIGDYKYGHFIGRAGEAMKNKVNCDIGIEII